MSNAITESVIGVADKVLGKFVADKDPKMKLEHELKTELHRANLAQISVNKIEAEHKSIFVSGWRPSVGWTCSISMLYHFLLAPMIQFGVNIAGVDVDLPEFDFTQLSTILMAMLGMSGLRSYEKIKGVSRDN